MLPSGYLFKCKRNTPHGNNSVTVGPDANTKLLIFRTCVNHLYCLECIITPQESSIASMTYCASAAKTAPLISITATCRAPVVFSWPPTAKPHKPSSRPRPGAPPPPAQGAPVRD